MKKEKLTTWAHILGIKEKILTEYKKTGYDEDYQKGIYLAFLAIDQKLTEVERQDEGRDE
jgi:hypothetical protein